MGLEKRETRGEIRISRYADGSFASAQEMITTEVLEDGKVVLARREEWRPVEDEAALQAMLGPGVVEARAHIDRVEKLIADERAAHEEKLDTLQADLARLTRSVTAAAQIVEAVRAADARWNESLAPLLREPPAPSPKRAEQ